MPRPPAFCSKLGKLSPKSQVLSVLQTASAESFLRRLGRSPGGTIALAIVPRAPRRVHRVVCVREFHHRHRRLRSFRRASEHRIRTFSFLFSTGRWRMPHGFARGGNASSSPYGKQQTTTRNEEAETALWPERSGFLRCCHGGQCGTAWMAKG